MSTTFADDFLPMLNYLVTIEPYLGESGTGARLYGPAKTYHAYLDGQDHLTRNADGEQTVATGTLYVHPRATDGVLLTQLAPTPVQAVLARCTRADGTVLVPISVSALYDENGLVFYVITS